MIRKVIILNFYAITSNHKPIIKPLKPSTIQVNSYYNFMWDNNNSCANKVANNVILLDSQVITK